MTVANDEVIRNMKKSAIILIALGLFFQAFALFNSRLPYPVVSALAAPENHAAKKGFYTLVDTGTLKEGDVGFEEIRGAILGELIESRIQSFPREDMGDLSVVRLDRLDPVPGREDRMLDPVDIVYSKSWPRKTTLHQVTFMVTDLNTQAVAKINAALLILGCGLVYMGLRSGFPAGGAEAIPE